MKEAYYYQSTNDGVMCTLCPHYCQLRHNQTGKCGTRKCMDTKLMAMNYGQLTAVHLDPIEKKPLYGFMPNTKTLSIGSYGCNFHCTFCQNYEIAQKWQHYVPYTSDDIIKMAVQQQVPSISYTYNEPTVFYEFVLDTAQKANEIGLKNILVTNGFINALPLKALLPYVDALNVDFKSYDDNRYKKVCGGYQEAIYNTLELTKEKHVEVTFLIVPNLNDDVLQLEEVFKKLKCINPNIIIHITRYFPRYLMSEAATDIALMLRIQGIAKGYFNHVYLGNV